MSKKTNTEWTVHMEALRSAKEELQWIGRQLTDAKTALDNAIYTAGHTVKIIAPQIGHYTPNDPQEALDTTIAKLLKFINETKASPAQMTIGLRDKLQAWEKKLAALEPCAQAWKRAFEDVGLMEASKAEAAATLEDVESKQPKPTEAALDTVTAERDRAQEDESRLAIKLEEASRKLESLQANGPNTLRIDALAAEKALSEDGKGPSDTAIAAAQKELDMEQAEIQSQESAVRGLDGLHAKAATTLEDLEALRCHIGEVVLGIRNKMSEEKFVKAVAAMEEALQELELDRRKLNAVLPSGTEYARPQAKITLPSLYAVTDLPQPTTRLAILP